MRILVNFDLKFVTVSSNFILNTQGALVNDINDTFCAGLIYIPEIKYRRMLNKAFGPGGWALVPRGESLQFQVK